MIERSSRNTVQFPFSFPICLHAHRQLLSRQLQARQIPKFSRRRRHHAITVKFRVSTSFRYLCSGRVPNAVLFAEQAAPPEASTFPEFIPHQVSEIEEEAALNMARSIQRIRLDVPSLGQPVDTAYVEEIAGNQRGMDSLIPSN